jgi:AmmeMemoRadiSam system protein A
MQISEEVKGVLLIAARSAIDSLFEESHPLIIDYDCYPVLLEKNIGAFVTLTEDNQLRGCIGYIDSMDQTLIETVCNAAKHAAVNDPRFNPLRIEELPEINIEISLLSPFTPINDYEEIQLGIHGLLLREGSKQGLLLPQVATENKFTLPQFLNAICQKTGVSSNLWRTKKLNLLIFTAVVFSEIGKRKRTHESV